MSDGEDPRSPEAFRNRLKLCAEKAGNLAVLARKMGVLRPTLHRYLEGSSPSLEMLIRLADAAGTSVEWLATGGSAIGANKDDEMRRVLREKEAAGWVTVGEFANHTVSPTGVIDYSVGREAVRFNSWIVPRAFPKLELSQEHSPRLALFEVKDDLMSPDLLKDQFAIFEVYESIYTPRRVDDIVVVSNGKELSARFAAQTGRGEIVLTHRKPWIGLPERVLSTDLGKHTTILGRALLVGAWVGSLLAAPQPIDTSLHEIKGRTEVIIKTTNPDRTIVIRALEQLGAKGVLTLIRGDIIFADVPLESISIIRRLRGVRSVASFSSEDQDAA